MVAALTVAACGTSVAQRDATYSEQLRTIDHRFTVSIASVLAAVGPSTPRAREVTAVGGFETALAGVETQLRALAAPAIVAQLHRHLVKAIARYGASVRREVSVLGSSHVATLTAGARRFRQATRRVAAVVAITVGAIRLRLRADDP